VGCKKVPCKVIPFLFHGADGIAQSKCGVYAISRPFLGRAHIRWPEGNSDQPALAGNLTTETFLP